MRKLQFALGGGLAAWARGGPPTEHDIDFLIRVADADAVLATLREAGMEAACPPEGWLLKAWQGPSSSISSTRRKGFTVDDHFFARCDELNVAAVNMLVMSLDDLLVGKLLTLHEHSPPAVPAHGPRFAN